MIDSMRKNIHKLHLTSYDTKHKISTVICSLFVDDTSLAALSTTHLTADVQNDNSIAYLSAVNNLKSIAQHWECLHFSTGGAINFHKSHWFVMAWKWRNGIPSLATINDSQAMLQLSEGLATDNLVTVPRIEPTSTFHTLGAYVCLGGDMTEARSILRNKSVEFAWKISSTTLSRQDAYWAYILHFKPQVGNSLPAVAFDKADCTYIQAPVLNAILSKVHLNQNTSRAIIFGSPEYAGACNFRSFIQ